MSQYFSLISSVVSCMYIRKMHFLFFPPSPHDDHGGIRKFVQKWPWLIPPLGHKSIVKISWKNHQQKSSQSGALFRHRIQVKVVFVRDVDNDKSVNLGLIEREKNNEQKFKWWQFFDINDQLDVDAVQRTESLQIMPLEKIILQFLHDF